MKTSAWTIVLVLCCRALVSIAASSLHAQPSTGVCPRPQPGSMVEEPEDLRSHNGVLEADLTARNSRPDGSFAIALPMGKAGNLPICASLPATLSFFI